MRFILPFSGCLLFAAIAVAWQPPPDPSFAYVGHRGASYLAPENTLASFQLAWKLGADAAECDVMLTSDNRVIVFHDKNSKRLTGNNGIIRNTPWSELSQLTIIPRKTNLPEYKDEHIPLLAGVLATIPVNRMLVIEIKTGPEIMPYLQKVVDLHWKSGKIAFIAFDFESIRAAKESYPEVPCYYLSSSKPDLNNKFDAILQANLDGVDLMHRIIDRELAERCHAAGLEIWCWTVNDPETAREMRSLGVTAVTTDRPAWLKEHY